MRKEKECPLKCINIDGNILTKGNEIMARWKEYFIELSEGTEKSSCTEKGQFEIYEQEENDINDITETEMAMAIQKTKFGKAGHDVISPGMIKYMSKEGKTMISNITKLAWKYQKMP